MCEIPGRRSLIPSENGHGAILKEPQFEPLSSSSSLLRRAACTFAETTVRVASRAGIFAEKEPPPFGETFVFGPDRVLYKLATAIPILNPAVHLYFRSILFIRTLRYTVTSCLAADRDASPLRFFNTTTTVAHRCFLAWVGAPVCA